MSAANHLRMVRASTLYSFSKYLFFAQQKPCSLQSAVISPYKSFAFAGIFAYRTSAGMIA